jgi:predicted nucleic acid-binding Zn ribbon protein
MALEKKITCPSCGFTNPSPPPHRRCVSCGAKFDELSRTLSRHEELERRYQQEGFSLMWFAVALTVMAVLTAAVVVGLPLVIPAVDFEGSAGMMVAIPVWFVGGLLVGLISPGKTFIEPVMATFLIAIPTTMLLYRSQTVKTMPYWMYILLSAVGVLFTLVGAYLGERIQMGPPPKEAD